jgi:hypothetical protein
VEGIAEPVVVDLEVCYNSDSSELQQHDFEAELAAARSISVSEVKKNLSILQQKFGMASALFEQVNVKIKSKARMLLRINEPTGKDVVRFIEELVGTYCLSSKAYDLLLEVIEEFWDYCPLKMRAYFKVKAQEILDMEYRKITLSAEDIVDFLDKEAPETPEFKFSLSLSNGKEMNLSGLIDLKEIDINSSILESIEWHNKYVDASLRFAYSVFGAIARDNNRGELGGVDETEYLFELSEKNAERLRSAIEDTESGGSREMTLEELCEELNIGEKEEQE